MNKFLIPFLITFFSGISTVIGSLFIYLKPKNIKTFSVIEESKQEVLSFKGKEFFGLYPEYNMTEDDIFNLQKDACISNLIL